MSLLGERWSQKVSRNPNGTTDVDVVVVREGRNAKVRVSGFLLGTVAKAVLAKALANTVKVVEARNNQMPTG